MTQLVQDLRFAARTFCKRPGFTLIAILTLALGIGAATAVFSIVNEVLLRPLPYRDPDRLVAVWITSTREKGLAKLFATHTDYEEFRRDSKSLESVAVATWATNLGRVLTGRGPARSVMTVPASANFFDTLGVQASIGRTFTSEDESRGCSIVVAHKFWTSMLAADPSIVGKSLTLDEKPCTVLGVMPERFSFYPSPAQAWVLLGPDYPDRAKMLVGIFARLKPGVTAARTETELRSLYRASHTTGESRDFQPVVYDLHGEFTFLAGRTLRTTLILVFAAVLLVLLIACLNVANLLLARISARRREFAVRAALGSGRSRLIQQVLTEGLLLSFLGAGFGVFFAYFAVRYFRLANPIELSVGADVGIHPVALGFSVLLCVTSTLIFSLLPAFRASQVDLTRTLKPAQRGNLARVVIAVEMALSFVLLTGAGLLMISALRMGSEPLGFNAAHVFATRVGLPASRYPGDTQRMQFYDRLLSRLQQIPGIGGAALASKVPPEAGGNQTLEIQGHASGPEMHEVGADAVSPSFFDVLNIPLRQGRVFDLQDREYSQPVAIINDSLAQKYFAHSDPLGQQIRIPGMPWLTVVGVVGNLKHTQLMNEMSWVETPIFYRPLAQEPRPFVQAAVRSSGDVKNEIQNQIAAIDPTLPLSEVELLTTRVDKTLAYSRFRAIVLAFFAFSAVILSAVGLNGVLSQLVTRRIPEFGVRRAVGAQTHHLIWLIVRNGGIPVVAGLAAGVMLTLLSSRLLASLLYGIQPADPKALAVVSLTLLLVAGFAIFAPAMRAARVDPMVALREE